MLSSHCENMLPYPDGRLAVRVDRRYRPNVEVAPNCPRCDSPNTKFCYYNNYSLSQPRYFCKGCRRYWTKGGSLRNVPVGGGCRKNRRGKSVRSMGDTVTNHGVTFSHRLLDPIRPDLVLERMVGNPASPGQIMSADKPAEADGSAIDLAMLYAKFLNHQPDVDRCAVMPESVDTLSGSSDMSPIVQAAPVRFGPSQASTESCTAMLQAPGQLSFCVDQSCYHLLGLQTDGADLILSSTWEDQAKYEPFDSLDAMSLHEAISIGDDDWSSALGCQGLEALCRPL